MNALEFDVSVKVSTFVSIYFQLRDFAEISSRPWALEPVKSPKPNRNSLIEKVVQYTNDPNAKPRTTENNPQQRDLHPLLDSFYLESLPHITDKQRDTIKEAFLTRRALSQDFRN